MKSWLNKYEFMSSRGTNSRGWRRCRVELELIACHISVRLSHAPAVYVLTILISQRHGRARPLFLHNGT